MEHTETVLFLYIFKVQNQQIKTGLRHSNTNAAFSYAALLPLFAKLWIPANLQDFVRCIPRSSTRMTAWSKQMLVRLAGAKTCCFMSQCKDTKNNLKCTSVNKCRNP